MILLGSSKRAIKLHNFFSDLILDSEPPQIDQSLGVKTTNVLRKKEQNILKFAFNLHILICLKI